MSKPQSLQAVRAILRPDMGVTLKSVSDSFYQELDTDFTSFHQHTLISEHSFDAPWGVWELHPCGDEVVYLLAGEAEFTLLKDGLETSVRLTNPGEYLVVPRGAWHTATPTKPTKCLFVTPGEGTVNALTPGGEPL